ncbi:MAG: iron-containing alcohol dehydrogenase [Candidatus Limnocylindrales bacterium]|jgi:glycerol-1-phosphate dehydrogenase [NAD(P)+]
MSLATQPRSIRIPRLMRLVRGADEAVLAMGELIERARPVLVVHTGDRSATGYGSQIASAARAAGFRLAECIIAGADQVAVLRVEAAIEADRPDFVVGVGGGRALDVAKLACGHKDLDFVSVPTQFASDAICSPIAVITDPGGSPESLGARMPTAIIVDRVVVGSAPSTTWLSGLGDLVSNVSAVKDWRVAHATRGEPLDDFACMTSEAAALSVIEDDASLGDPDYREKVIRGLILSGIAMEMDGSSRPASGSEHLISHALDRILDRPRPHGLQVALGTIAAGHLRGDDVGRLVAFFRRTGLPVVPGDLGISVDELVEAVRRGPSTRPGRSTFLDGVGEPELVSLRESYERGGL